MKNILVIDNYDSFVYNLVQLLKENGKCRFDIVRNDRIDFTRLSRYDGLLLSPGPGIPAEAGDLLRVVNQCKTTHSILGICLGHQAIAESFGAKLERLPFPKHGHESPLIIQDTEDPIYRNLPSQAVIGRYHSWTVTPSTLPPPLKVSAIDEEGHIMSFYHPFLPIHGLQFHPESIITNIGSLLINNWINRIKIQCNPTQRYFSFKN